MRRGLCFIKRRDQAFSQADESACTSRAWETYIGTRGMKVVTTDLEEEGKMWCFMRRGGRFVLGSEICINGDVVGTGFLLTL